MFFALRILIKFIDDLASNIIPIQGYTGRDLFYWPNCSEETRLSKQEEEEDEPPMRHQPFCTSF